MKRSVAQEFPSQEASSKMSRHDLEAVEKTEPLTTNIFLVETILRRLFKQIETVSMLKELRKVCQLWDKLDTEELEERAFQGRFKPINLTFLKKGYIIFISKNEAQSEMRRFLEDTAENPKLFRSFELIFPETLSILNMHKFRSFYTNYSPTFLDLGFADKFRFDQNKELLFKEFLKWAGPTLRILILRNLFKITNELQRIPDPKSNSVQHFNFPHLWKIQTVNYLRYDFSHEAFNVIFNQEFPPNTPSLTSLALRSPDMVNILGLNTNPTRWDTLTKLELSYDTRNISRRDENIYGFTNGLVTLASAGMTLKKLNLCIRHDHWIDEDSNFAGICQNLSVFFASQAGSIEALNFEFKLLMIFEEDKDAQVMIQLPVFERLHNLSMCLETQMDRHDLHYNFFNYTSIPHNFPDLEDLTFRGFNESLNEFLGQSSEVEDSDKGMNLKRIKISEYIFWGKEEGYNRLDKYFGSIEAFACRQETLQDLKKVLGGLMNTIRGLQIRDVNSELDLSQFKGLKKVIIVEEHPVYVTGKMRKLIEDNGREYLAYFKKVAELELDSIIFRGFEMICAENLSNYKELYTKAFPFQVQFEEKPTPWYNEDFMDN